MHVFHLLICSRADDLPQSRDMRGMYTPAKTMEHCETDLRAADYLAILRLFLRFISSIPLSFRHPVTIRAIRLT